MTVQNQLKISEQVLDKLENDFVSLENLRSSDLSSFEILFNLILELVSFDRKHLDLIMYKLDVKENQYVMAFQEQTNDSVAAKICELILIRESQKMETRSNYPQDRSILPDELKW